MTNFHAFWITIAVLTFSPPSPLLAHGLEMKCRKDKDHLEVEVFYDGGGAAGEARIKVSTEAGKLVAEGTADAQGKFRCPVPEKEGLIVGAEHAGHRTVTSIHPDGSAGVSSHDQPFHLDGPLWKVLFGILSIGLLAWIAKKLLRAARGRPGGGPEDPAEKG